MKIGLIDVDGHAKKKKWGATIYPNLALCKIALYHKQQGDIVEQARLYIHTLGGFEKFAEWGLVRANFPIE